jgi:thiamine monophosphate kinase
MQNFHSALSLTVIPTGVFAAYDLIGFSGAKVTTDDAAVLGVAQSPCTVIGDPTTVMAIGFARVKAVGAITVGAKLISAAAGGVKAAGATPANAFAIALTAAADGEFVDILVR